MNKDIVLQAVNISRTYDGKVPVRALKNCSVQFERGEFAAIIGKSGSGKSTLLRILGTLDMPDEGTVKIGDIDIYGGSTRLSDRQLSQFRRRNIGFVYQDYNLFPEYTAYENIIFPVHLDKRLEDSEELMDIMEKIGIEHCRDKFPFEMSGGEKQRVSLARALVNKPAVILADEPTGNLDAETSSEVAALLRNASDMFGQTIVMVTHDRQMADFADRVLVIKDGVLR